MKKELLFVLFLILTTAMPLASCLQAQDLVQIEQIIEDKNNELERNIIQKITEKQDTSVDISAEFRGVLQEERIKTIMGNAVAIFLALILYSFIRFKLKLKEKEVTDYATNRNK